MRLFYGFLLAFASTCFALRLQTESPKSDAEFPDLGGDEFDNEIEAILDDLFSKERGSGSGSGSGSGTTISRCSDPYDFSCSDEWRTANFEERWRMFTDAVPVQMLQANYDPELDSGPVCYPTLIGPKNSDKLVILLHGFLSCPGLWFRTVPLLLERGFRVMLPTLPGHGRAWRLPSNGTINMSVVDLSDGPMENSSDTVRDLSDAEDDIDDIPTDAKPYHFFAQSLGELAAAFKNEHPLGVVAVAGHSLGGAITAKYAMNNPKSVDRVMLLNPMLGLSSGWINTIAYMSPNWRLSKGSKCERQRGKGSGGTCQFKLAHVSAMVKFAYDILCYQFGVLKHSECQGPSISRMNMGHMKGFQVVTTRGETSVDNGRIKEFVRVVAVERTSTQGVTFSHGHDPHFCQWPADLGHSYLSNRKKNASSSDKWWHPYVETALANFLIDGDNVEVVRVGSINDCLVSSSNVFGEFVNLLPAIQHPHSYLIGKSDSHAFCRGNCASAAQVLYAGYTSKQSHTWKKMHDRHIEILMYGDRYLIVTRLHESDNIRDIYVFRDMDTIDLTKMPGGMYCMTPKVDDADIDIPLDDALAKVEYYRGRGYKPRVLEFCGNGFARVACQNFGCKSDVDFWDDLSPSTRASWQCHHYNYEAGEGDDWCKTVGNIHYGYEFQFNGGNDSPCGECWCCKRKAMDFPRSYSL